MFFLGIDIGKNTHVASLIDDKGKTVFKAFSFPNSTIGGSSLLNKLAPFSNEIEIGMEATGHYWLALYSFLVEHGFVIHIINPIQTDGWRNATEIRKHKTDIIDSIVIADFIRYGEFLETSLANEDVLSLRNLTRFRNYLVSSIGDLKRKTICILDQIFPEYESVFLIFSEKHQRKSYCIFLLLPILNRSPLSSSKLPLDKFLVKICQEKN